MKQCHQLDAFLNKQLSAPELDLFAHHLDGCDDCQERVQMWELIAQETKGLAQEQVALQTNTSRSAEKHIIEQVDSGRTDHRLLRPAIVWAAAAIVVIAIAAVLWRQTDGSVETIPQPASAIAVNGTRIFPGGNMPLKPSLSEGGAIRTRSKEQVMLQFGEDRVGIGEKSVLWLEKSERQSRQLRLEKGNIACSVEKRTQGEDFVVSAAGFEVRVVGTQFLVSVDDAKKLKVVVVEGVVEVSVASEVLRTVRAGEQFVATGTKNVEVNAVTQADAYEIKRLLSIKWIEDAVTITASDPDEGAAETDTLSKETAKTKSSKNTAALSLPELQQWVLDGRIDEASRALKQHLKNHPNNAESWFLLADCQKRQGEFKAAVSSYQKVAGKTRGAIANTARYRAGIVLQDKMGNHPEAIRLFEQYLKNPGQDLNLAPTAKLRLAQSLIRVGKKSRANALLKDIIDNHKRTPAAQKAGRLLEHP
ncbi:tetratricopeptide repeat protein [Desulfosarcina sp.]|uniref:tetratricopeptide repeat protein n=1 Tax=Desulfosarcina sp. TaxID=2027861 RepID=UPI0029B33AF4|nr:tetratricopeptide repeat protein [Desulfosarcina sp.]MDX2454746.1 tetratricopeptide repeat protein [Desulfosarcina sp.]